MRNLSVRFKLYLLLVCFLMSLAVVGGCGWLGISQAQRNMANISQSLVGVDSLSTLHTARLSSIAAMQEGASWRPDSFEDQPNKADAIAEANSLFADISARHQKSLALADRAYQVYDEFEKSADAQALWDEFCLLWQEFQEANTQQTEIALRLAKVTDWHSVNSESTALVVNTPPWVQAIQLSAVTLERLIASSVASAERAKLLAETSIATTQRVIVAVFILATLVLGGLSVLIVQSVVSPLRQLRQRIEHVGDTSDFTQRADSHGMDEVAMTAKSFNILLERMQSALKVVTQGAGQIIDAATQTSTMAQAVVAGVEQQNDAANDISSAVEQMSASISHISNSTQAAVLRAQDTADAAHAGVISLKQSDAENAKILKQVHRTSESIETLGQESTRISVIIGVITGIAEQINLLALNAAIEAARAGDHGRGFTVVADEVRSLATRTSTSAAQVREMVNAIQHLTNKAIEDMEGMVITTQQGRILIESVAGQIDAILTCAADVTEAVASVSQAMSEQHHSTELIALRIEHVVQMSQKNCAIGDHAQAVSNDLQGAANNLQQATSRFRV